MVSFLDHMDEKFDTFLNENVTTTKIAGVSFILILLVVVGTSLVSLVG